MAPFSNEDFYLTSGAGMGKAGGRLSWRYEGLHGKLVQTPRLLKNSLNNFPYSNAVLYILILELLSLL